MITSLNVNADWLDTIKDITGSAGDSSSSNDTSLTNSDIAGAFKDALTIGSDNVVSQLSAPGGFNTDSNIRIPLPDSLQSVKKALDTVGMGDSLTDLEYKLNEAAESATKNAKPLFLNAIQEMTWTDAQEILNGPDDSATQYFKNKMSEPLAESMKPIVDESLNDVGAINSYNQVMSNYDDIPFAPDVQANLTDHVLDKGIDGIFYYLAQEEKAIRENPAKRTTDLMKKVFAD
ncbi:MAG: DUF4197 domain-containing protein [Pseudomonadota bacterium]